MTADPIPSPIARKRLPGLAVVGLVLLAIVVIFAGLWWWMMRPIEPVDLTQRELALLQAKLAALEKEQGPRYEKGSKDIILTEREINGLLNQNTNLGDQLRLEFSRNAIHARIETDLDPELPVVGGKRLKAKARFVLAEDAAGKPTLELEDVTVWGISLPNEWLGHLKGRDLLGDALGHEGGGIPGVEWIRIEPGRLVIRLSE